MKGLEGLGRFGTVWEGFKRFSMVLEGCGKVIESSKN